LIAILSGLKMVIEHKFNKFTNLVKLIFQNITLSRMLKNELNFWGP